jgi:hypothetical protein
MGKILNSPETLSSVLMKKDFSLFQSPAHEKNVILLVLSQKNAGQGH